MSVLAFVRQLVRNPLRIGAIVPSSRTLASRMVQDLDFSVSRVVVELGSGTGAFSLELVHRMKGRGQLILVERSEALAIELRARFPQAIVICDCVSNLSQHLEHLGHTQVDYIVSGLPWTLFPQDLQDRCLEQIHCCLKPGGKFVTFIYLHGMRFLNLGVRFERKLGRLLGRIQKSRPVWRNLPPAMVWTWQRPLLLPGQGQAPGPQNQHPQPVLRQVRHPHQLH